MKWQCLSDEVTNYAPVAQLGERRLPRSGKAKHCFARSERREPTGEGPGSRSAATRGVPGSAKRCYDEVAMPF
jgi:hypothetical protein